MEDNHRFQVINAGRRWGKTTLSIEKIKGKGVFTKDALISYIAPTYRQAREIVWNDLKRELRGNIVNLNETRLEIEFRNIHGGVSKVDLRGWESIESLRGQKRHHIICDEVSSMKNFWLQYHEVIRPLLSDYAGDGVFISTPKGYNHFYDLYNKELTDQDFKSFKFTTYDNPYISVEEIESAKKSMPDDIFRQEFMGDFTRQEGLVYPEFNRDIHIVQETPKFKTIIAGVDFGYTNPTGVLFVGVDSDDNYFIFDESYKTQQTKEQTIAILSKYPLNYVYADPEDAEGIAKLKQAHFNVMEVDKSKIDGINAVREFLLQKRLKVLNKCINFIEEIEGYTYKENKDDRNAQEEPNKLNDHLMDCIKYIVFNHKLNKYSFDNKLRVMQNRLTNKSFE